MRLPLEVAEAVRGSVGPDLIVGMRIPGDELVEGGLNIAQMRDIAPRLAGSGYLDYLNVIAGSNMDRIGRVAHWPPTPAPHGLFVDLAAEIRKVVDVPVFTTGRITNAKMAEEIISQGKADMVGMTRAQIADPDLVQKLKDGRVKDIRPCVGANVCIMRALGPGPIRCLHNPEAAREYELGPLVVSKEPKRVVVIGAGPGGLEAARVAAERGHQVEIYEAENYIGGQFLLRASIPTWTEFDGVIEWRRRQLSQLQVPIHLGQRINESNLSSLDADVIILATGAIPKDSFDIDHDGSIPITSPHKLIKDGAGDALSAVIWDRAGGIVATGAMDAALSMGLSLDIVTPQFMVAEDTDVVQRIPLYERLLSGGARFHPNSDIINIKDGVTTFRNVYSYKEQALSRVDLIIAWNGRSAQDSLYDLSIRLGIKTYAIGDAMSPRTAEYAIAEGALIARKI